MSNPTRYPQCRTVSRSKGSSTYAIAFEEGIPALLVEGEGAGSYERQIDAFGKATVLLRAANEAARAIEARAYHLLRASQGS